MERHPEYGYIYHIHNPKILRHDPPSAPCRCFTTPFDPAELRDLLLREYALGESGMTAEEHADLIVARSIERGVVRGRD